MLVLGIDAAWTAHHPSGIALVEQRLRQSKLLVVAPSLDQFVGVLQGQSIDWKQPAPNTISLESLDQLLELIQDKFKGSVQVIAVDMPIGRMPVVGRRVADNVFSKYFTRYGCPVHSPLPDRPGAISHRFCRACAQVGFEILTTDSTEGQTPGVMEVYPHAALLSLLKSNYRRPYKTSRTTAYWPGLTISERKKKLLSEWNFVAEALGGFIQPSATFIPNVADANTWNLRQLKAVEDGLDAIISAWVGCEYLVGRTQAFGDREAAIWTTPLD